jgi:hypothetical protein
MTFADETLMAFADGELAPDEAARVAAAMAIDPMVAARVELFTQGRKMVQVALGAPPPVSDALTARIRALAEADARQETGASEAANVVSLAARRRLVPIWQLPIAASIALAVGFAAGWSGAPNDPRDGGLALASLDDPALVSALETQKAGARLGIGGDAEVSLVASFLGRDGSLCREFEHAAGGTGMVAVACHRDAVWTVDFAVATPAPDADGYVPASSLDALDAWLTASEAGSPLSEAEETAALAALR